MNSLYGDLPPTAGGQINDNDTPPTNSISKPVSRSKPTTAALKPRQASSVKPSSMLPTALAFKPRSTAVPSTVLSTASSASASAPAPAPAPASSSSSGGFVMNYDTASSANTSGSSFTASIQKKEVLTRIDSNDNRAHPGTISTDTDKSTSKMISNENSSWDLLGEEEYDVNTPNDYIAYCEERLEQRKFEKLQKENKRLILEQESNRTKVEQERREASMKGDYAHFMPGNSFNTNTPSNAPMDSQTMQIPSSASMMPPQAGAGRGRGRGALSNLPAWMTALNAQAASGGEEPTPQHPDQFNDMAPPRPAGEATGPPGVPPGSIGVKRTKGLFSKPSCVVLLKNMVGPCEVDAVLADETKQECLKYGPVSMCVVFEVESESGGRVTPDDERVRTFVAFERQESAVKAYRDLNGRFFGGRQISASFYDEDKFGRRELAPTDKEW